MLQGHNSFFDIIHTYFYNCRNTYGCKSHRGKGCCFSTHTLEEVTVTEAREKRMNTLLFAVVQVVSWTTKIGYLVLTEEVADGMLITCPDWDMKISVLLEEPNRFVIKNFENQNQKALVIDRELFSTLVTFVSGFHHEYLVSSRTSRQSPKHQ